MNLTITEPDGTTTKINSPGAAADTALLARLRDAAAPAAPQATLGGPGGVAAARAHPPTGTPTLVAALRRARRPGGRGHLATRRSLALADAPRDGARPTSSSPTARSSPAHRRRRRRDRGGPRGGRGGGPGSWTGARARSSPRSAAPAPCSSPPRAPGTPRPPPTTVVSTVGAGDSSLFGYLLGDLRGADAGRAAPPRRGLRQRRRRLPGTTIPRRTRSTRSLVDGADDPSDLTREDRGTTCPTSSSTGPRAARRRPRRRQARGDPLPRRRGRRGGPQPQRRPASPRTRSPGRPRRRPGLPGGIAIPHCRTEHVDVPTLAFARLSPGTDFGAKDGPADLAFLIAAPAGGDATHLQLLTKLARALVKKDSPRAARRRDARGGRRAGQPSRRSAPPAAAAAPRARPRRAPAAAAPRQPAPERRRARQRRSIVAVTACPTGIAHTYMAAESLEAAAARAGVDIHVETQGSAGSTPLPARRSPPRTPSIFATDVGVQGPRPLRRQADGRLRRQAGHRRRRRDDPRGARATPTTRTPPGSRAPPARRRRRRRRAARSPGADASAAS